MTKLATAIALVAVTISALMKAKEIPTAKASMLVAMDIKRMFAMVSFLEQASAASSSSPRMAPQIMRPPRMQRIAQAMGVPMELNQRSAKFPRK